MSDSQFPPFRRSANVSRRALLQGSLGALAASLLLPRAAHAGAAATGKKPAKAVILLWMNGGPSHIDTWDPKSGPDGTAHKRIKTKNKNLEIVEPLSEIADVADRITVVRSLTHKEGNHQRAQYLMHTGYSPNPTVTHPSFGGWVGTELGDPKGGLPAFVSIGGPSFSAGFLGVEHGPFVLPRGGDLPRNSGYAAGVDAERFDARKKLLDGLDGDFLAKTGDRKVAGRHEVTEKALRLMRSPDLAAFNIAAESETTRAAFGDTDFGRGCLGAVRLVEHGVKFVEVVLDGWDTHLDVNGRTEKLGRTLAPAYAALLKELASRKLLDDTLVLWMGDFGRTPKRNGNDGRDHHPKAASVVLAGGGIRPGQVYGATDERGDNVVKDPVTLPNLLATCATLLGIDPDEKRITPIGRPISVTDSGKPIAALIAS